MSSSNEDDQYFDTVSTYVDDDGSSNGTVHPRQQGTHGERIVGKLILYD
jgi:hypothetical protein